MSRPGPHTLSAGSNLNYTFWNRADEMNANDHAYIGNNSTFAVDALMTCCLLAFLHSLLRRASNQPWKCRFKTLSTTLNNLFYSF